MLTQKKTKLSFVNNMKWFCLFFFSLTETKLNTKQIDNKHYTVQRDTHRMTLPIQLSVKNSERPNIKRKSKIYQLISPASHISNERMLFETDLFHWMFTF